MNQILEWLTGGDLRSDGLSNEAAAFVLENPDLLDELLAGLAQEDEVVRGRTADALEKVARRRPDLLANHIPRLIQVLDEEHVPMVKMHIAMILGHLADRESHIPAIISALLQLLEDESVFAVSWTIAGLCLIGRLYPGERGAILNHIARLDAHPSVAVRTRVRNGLMLLADENAPFPKGWIKSAHLQHLGGGK
jgi:HEAT repeat protein